MATLLTRLEAEKKKSPGITILTKEKPDSGPVSTFLAKNFLHFNSAALMDGARAYIDLMDRKGKMFLAMAGAMSTGEIGKTLAEMIRRKKIHAICCTGANLEEDVFNLVAHDSYVRIPNYRDLTPKDEQTLLDKHLPRVTDVCIPEKQAMSIIEEKVLKRWKKSDDAGESRFPHEFLYDILLSGELSKEYEIPPKDSWMLAAAEADLPIYVPGWEDSTLGNMFAAQVHSGKLKKSTTVKGGVEYMLSLLDWYKQEATGAGVGFFQIGGGIAGDFPICVVPLWKADLKNDKIPLWSYFCQISDSTTSYGSYSGAVPNEKITWWKLGPDTPKFVIESDASIVWPLVAACVLEY